MKPAPLSAVLAHLRRHYQVDVQIAFIRPPHPTLLPPNMSPQLDMPRKKSTSGMAGLFALSSASHESFNCSTSSRSPCRHRFVHYLPLCWLVQHQSPGRDDMSLKLSSRAQTAFPSSPSPPRCATPALLLPPPPRAPRLLPPPLHPLPAPGSPPSKLSPSGNIRWIGARQTGMTSLLSLSSL